MTNEQRSKQAQAALATAYTQGDIGLIDLLADLLHYADQHGIDFDEALRLARIHHTAEA